MPKDNMATCNNSSVVKEGLITLTKHLHGKGKGVDSVTPDVSLSSNVRPQECRDYSIRSSSQHPFDFESISGFLGDNSESVEMGASSANSSE